VEVYLTAPAMDICDSSASLTGCWWPVTPNKECREEQIISALQYFALTPIFQDSDEPMTVVLLSLSLIPIPANCPALQK
jgi:hypothetical protein